MSHSDSFNFAPLAEGHTSALWPAVGTSTFNQSFAASALVAPAAGHIAIVGAGNAARSLACFLSKQGFSPHILVRSAEKVKNLAQRKSIACVGKVEGDFSIVEATIDPGPMLAKCATVFVATTTDAYTDVARRLAPYLTEHHEVILFSGKFAGVVEFKNALGARANYPTIVETDSLFASRIQEDESVWIRGIKKWTLYTSWNKSQTKRSSSIMRRFFPGIDEAENVVQRGLTDFGAFAHPSTMIANMTNVDRNTGFLFYYEGFTPNTLILLEQLEEEFRSIARAYETSIIPMKELLNRYYGCDTSGDLLQAMRTVPNYSFSKAPGTLQHRFIEEDVASSLVPMQQLAVKAKVRIPLIDSIVSISSVLLQRDFASNGRTLGKLGWADMSHAEILRAIYE
ncbi:MAG: NAD/NADP octopine/nopaline dehydrogenase family protein [Candidatus Melainabacteria bacterium]|nr:NAD/NADP octopine/nopaline dehydrogenase family protein [Candidatus Melainabacteria bacterium]